jgi:hypothetical protein
MLKGLWHVEQHLRQTSLMLSIMHGLLSRCVASRLRMSALPLQAAVGRISHLQLARAFTRWVEAAQELKTLRAKAHQVLHNTLRRRMRNALASWEAYVEYCEAKRAKLALAERHWRQLYRRHGMAAWSAFVKVRWEGRWFEYMVCDIAKLCFLLAKQALPTEGKACFAHRV